MAGILYIENYENNFVRVDNLGSYNLKKVDQKCSLFKYDIYCVMIEFDRFYVLDDTGDNETFKQKFYNYITNADNLTFSPTDYLDTIRFYETDYYLHMLHDMRS